MKDHLVGYIGIAITVIGSILGVGRYVGRIEDRIEQLEKQNRYMYGTESFKD